ncbi:MAG: 50S ribosomal protein L13 [Deltaproteobacteria bacterium]|nr:50S ribosomal protein L13 [Deltaproteobacteria bacterium]
MRTKSAKKHEVVRQWFIVDAKDKVLGRLATRVATVLCGKHKTCYTPHTDTGDFVIVVNAQKVKVTGRKETDKMYYTHSGWQGHIFDQNLEEVRARKPERIVELAIKGMLPKGNLGRAMYAKLKVYAGADHPHTAQKPEALPL